MRAATVMKPDSKSQPVEKEQRKPPSQPRRASKGEPSVTQNSVLNLQRSIGNQGVVSLLHAGAIQAKLRVSQPGDADEREADRVAQEIVSSPNTKSTVASATSPTLHRKCNCPGGGATCPDCEAEEVEEAKGIHRKSASNSPDDAHAPDNLLQNLGPGSPLEPAVRENMESSFGRDFGDVRIHSDTRAAQSARAVNARAFTLGRDIVFDSSEYAPQTPSGKKLLAHELTHVVQQRNASQGTATRVHRRVNPEDVSSEMIGKWMTVTGPFTSGPIQLAGGELVEVVAWSNSLPTATVQLPIPSLHADTPFDIPKRLLSVDSPSAPGIAPYRAGISQEKAALNKGDQAIAKENARKGGPRPGEIPRLQGLQQQREASLNTKFIQETMMNRFDPVIRQWVDFYNTQFGFTGNKASLALDPNLVKSLFFQESQMGTSGEHLEIPTPGHPISHPVRSRFNIGQVIDSSALALLIMLREMQPALITTYHLENISQDLSTAQTEFQHLKAIHKRDAAQDARLAVLEPLSHQNWEAFLWQYRAPGQATGFANAVQDLFASAGPGQPTLDVDYDFWIRTAIRWLFEKRRSVATWPEAIRAYNGSGAAARHYRKSIVQRAQGAQRAQATGTEFVPPGL